MLLKDIDLLGQNYVKTVILWNIIIIKIAFF